MRDNRWPVVTMLRYDYAMLLYAVANTDVLDTTGGLLLRCCDAMSLYAVVNTDVLDTTGGLLSRCCDAMSLFGCELRTVHLLYCVSQRLTT